MTVEPDPSRPDQGTAFPFDSALSRPVWDGERLADLTIEAVHLPRTATSAEDIDGRSLIALLPELAEGTFLSEVEQAKGEHNGVVTRLRIAREGYPFHLVAYWRGDLVQTLALPIKTDDFTEQGLVFATERISAMMPEAPIGYALHTDTRVFRVASEKFLNAVGVDREEFESTGLMHRVHPDDRPMVERAFDTAEEGIHPSIEVRVITPAGAERWLQVWISAVDGPTGSHGRFTIVQDIDDSKRALEREEAARRREQDSREMLSKALNASAEGFAIWTAIRDADGCVFDFVLDFMNEVGARPSGQTVESLLGKPLSVVLSGESDGLQDLFVRALRSGATERYVVEVQGENGWVGAYENLAIALSADQVVTSFRDVSAERLEQRRLDALIKRDRLTGLLSRAGLEAAWAELDDSIGGLVLAFIDLDNFKHFNDTRGHDYGDRVLRGFAENLQRRVSEEDLLVRLSGDEFVWVASLRGHSLGEVAESMFARIHEPFEVDGLPIHVSASIGLVSARASDDLSDLLSQSDRAMYEVKRNGKSSLLVAKTS